MHSVVVRTLSRGQRWAAVAFETTVERYSLFTSKKTGTAVVDVEYGLQYVADCEAIEDSKTEAVFTNEELCIRCAKLLEEHWG